MRFKVAIREGPDGARVRYEQGLSLAAAERLAAEVPARGMAMIHDETRLLRRIFQRDEAGVLEVLNFDEGRRAEQAQRERGS